VTVQTMMGMRLLALQFLELRTIWTPDFLMFLILNVLATMLAVICLLPRWRQAPPTGVGEEVVVTTLL